MRRILTAATILTVSVGVALAQDEPGWLDRIFSSTSETDAEEDPGGFLERLIEDNLSGEGRNVEITGFAGAISGKATLETLRISDTNGTWLTLTDVTLDWSRAALLRGRIDVTELSAETIDLPRLPLPAEAQTPAPEAGGFSLPELPVSVEIDKIDAALVNIGRPVLGEDIAASITGNLSLISGEGAAGLDIQRQDRDGQFVFDASYSNASTRLTLDLSVTEGPDGLVANLAGLPGKPALDFTIKGDAPLNAFTADITLATDGQERFGGTILTRTPDDTPDATLEITADLGGDLAPVFLPEYQPFFGPDVALRTRVTQFSDGRLDISDIALEAQAVKLQGNIALASTGLPQTIDISGGIASPDGSPVLLPIPGPETRVDSVNLGIGFDAARGEAWAGEFKINGLDRPGFAADELTLAGQGNIQSQPSRAVEATFDFDVLALDLGDPNVEDALGEKVIGQLTLDWQQNAPLRITKFDVQGESYTLNGAAELVFSEEGPLATGTAQARAARLDAFSGLAQRQLAGAVDIDTAFTVAPLAGVFDISATGSSQDLIVSQPQADRILAGQAQLAIRAARSTEGTIIELNQLQSPNAQITGRIALETGSATTEVTASLADASLVIPELSGPVSLTASAEAIDGIWAWRTNTNLGRTTLTADGTARDIFEVPFITADGRLQAADIADFAALAQRPISGRVDTDFALAGTSDLSRASIELDGTYTDITTGQPQADALLTGPVSLLIDANLENGTYTLKNAKLDGQEITALANGFITDSTGQFTLSGAITDARSLAETAPEGPVAFRTEAARQDSDWTFDTALSGPAATVNATGTAFDPLGDSPSLSGVLVADLPDLSVFAGLADRPLAGQVSANAKGDLSIDLNHFDVEATVNASGIRTGNAEADNLLSGDIALTLDAHRDGAAAEFTTFDISTRTITATANGTLGTVGSQIDLNARLNDVAPFVSGIAGPATINGTIAQASGNSLDINVNATGPGGTSARISGTAADDFSTVNLNFDGQAPLGLANRFIQPRSLAGTLNFDLAVNGPPTLASVSGQMQSSGARFVAPAIGMTLENAELSVGLANARANINLRSTVNTGGTLAITGPVGLQAPFSSDLNITLNQVGLIDPRLFETTVTGTITASGPLAGGASIAGTLNLGETNIQIPSTGLGGAGDIPEVIHINEPPPVRGTRQRAGLLETADAGAGGSGPGFPLNIQVNAPNRVFVRGRGLDSEFGGGLQITGTSNDVIPIGAFNLIRGRLDILGQRLEIEDANITMQGSFVPVISLLASTRTDDATVNIVIEGPATNPDIAFTFDPDLPEEEVLARLIFGRGIETLSPLQAARLALAVRTLAGQGGEGVVGNIRRGAGLADFDVTTDEAGNTAVRAGAYLGDNLYTDVTVNAEGETELNLNLDVSNSVTLKGSATNTGETSIGIFYEQDY